MTDIESETVINIAKQFSPFPAGRVREDGKYSGMRFREEILTPALRKYKRVKVVFDGVAGLGSSFLEEAFGGLVRLESMDKEFLDMHLQIYTSEEELKDFVRMANYHIENATPQKQSA